MSLRRAATAPVFLPIYMAQRIGRVPDGELLTPGGQSRPS